MNTAATRRIIGRFSPITTPVKASIRRRLAAAVSLERRSFPIPRRCHSSSTRIPISAERPSSDLALHRVAHYLVSCHRDEVFPLRFVHARE